MPRRESETDSERDAPIVLILEEAAPADAKTPLQRSLPLNINELKMRCFYI